MKRTLLLTLDFPPDTGGVARYLGILAEFWSDRVRVISPHTEELMFKRVWPKWIKSIWIVWRERKDFDRLWISHIYPLGIVCLFAKIVLRKRYVVFFHGFDFNLAIRNEWKKALSKILINNAELIVTNSQFLANKIKKFTPAVATQVVYPCVKIDYPSKKIKNINVGGAIELITVSRLVERKGHLLVLKAIDELKKQGIETKYKIVGSGPFEMEIRNGAETLNLLDRVQFIANATDEEKYELMRGSDIFVMPTIRIGADTEGFGIVYTEAGFFGLPVVASNIPGVDESVEDGKSGFLVDEGDVSALVEVLKKLILNFDMRRALGEYGRARAEREFSCASQAKKLEKYV